MNKAQRVNKVLNTITKLYPKQLADSSWDNTGLLVDAQLPQSNPNEQLKQTPHVLLTIDLTEGVCDEAIKLGTDLILAYHPFIFSGIKAISTENPQHRSLIKLIKNNISVYCPHTAIDASTSGVNDWLVTTVTNQHQNMLSCTTIQPKKNDIKGQENAGYGRLVTLKNEVKISDLIQMVKANLWLPTVQLVKSTKHETEKIKSIAICAGSGSGVLKGVKADLWLTGELGHHDMLFLKESGTSAIVCGHSNTERGFLPALRHQLLKDLQDAEIVISRSDVDPIEYV